MSDFTNTINWEQDADGIVTLTMDDPNAGANTMNDDYTGSMGAAVDRLEAEKDSITGVVLTSAKKTFFAGGNLDGLKQAKQEHVPQVRASLQEIKAQLRRLEQLGKPVVAAINGAALGGGLELALATHHRIAWDGPGVQIGLPEVMLGLLPAGGGVTRTVRMFGIIDAMMKVLLQGQRYNAKKALEVGLVNELVDSIDQLVPKAKEWIKANPEAVQPWDVKGYKIPGGTPSTPALAMNLPAFPANLRKQLKGAPMPAPIAIMSTAVEGAQVNIDSAFEIENKYFLDLVTGSVAKNMIEAFFFNMQEVNGSRGRPEGIEKFRSKKTVVLGAGMMGAAIAYVCANAGIEVVLKDIDQAAADRGKGYSEKLLDKKVAKGRMTEEAKAEFLSRITATIDPAAAQDADLVIEAVFEDPEIKAKVFAEIEPFLAPGAILGSNTSTLPITGLAEGVSRPADFIGLHFFSPVDKMPLLEIIKGEKTSDEVLYKSLDFSQQIKKTPIVVNDSRGFFTSRVIGTFIHEGIAMLTEGVPAPTIEQASNRAGYPAPVLQLSDELNMKLMGKIRKESIEAAEAAGITFPHSPAFDVIDYMLEQGRPGRLEGKGFFEYDEAGKRQGFWSGIKDKWATVADPSEINMQDLVDRMLFIESIETIKCVDEGVIESAADANIGSIMGIGFPAWTGGVLQYINTFSREGSEESGPAEFVARANELTEKYGERFTPPASLLELAKSGELYEGKLSAVATA